LPRITLKALYAKAFRAPSINETRLNHPGLEGTPGLLPEQVGTFDFQAIYQGSRSQSSLTFFRSDQSDSINIDISSARWKYRNFGKATFQGVEVEEKYYFKRDIFISGSALYQANWDGNGVHNVTPIANFSAKAGLSYQSQNGFTASVFDVYQHLDSASATVNPPARSFHLVNSYLRYDLSRYLRQNLALFVKADNLVNRQIWLPDLGGNSGDTIPVNGGRTIYFGFEVTLSRD